jgi:hypothetical protein
VLIAGRAEVKPEVVLDGVGGLDFGVVNLIEGLGLGEIPPPVVF